MTRKARSAGAVVVTADVHHPETLLLDQTRVTGERQTVAPKGRIEPGESPLVAAAREVHEETGIDRLLYAGYLGKQSYEFTDPDGSAQAKTVNWFLFATHHPDTAPLSTEGFTAARWVPLDRAPIVASHDSFGVYLRRADDIISWRQAGPLPYSTTLSDLVWQTSQAATKTLSGHPAAGIGLCGSAARGDFVEGWSDIDLVGWGIAPMSQPAQQLQNLVTGLSKEYGIPASLRLAAPDGRTADQSGPRYDMKLRAVLHRTDIDLPVIAGGPPPPSIEPPDDLGANLLQHYAFAVDRLTSPATSAHDRADGTRRVLSAASNAGRTVATTLQPDTSLRLPAVAARLYDRWPRNQLARLLSSYDTFRRTGASDLAEAEALAAQVPQALDELHGLVSDQRTPSGSRQPAEGEQR